MSLRNSLLSLFHKKHQRKINTPILLIVLRCLNATNWHDAKKLQHQVEILEQFPEVSLCTGGYTEVFEDESRAIIIPQIRENQHPYGYFLI